MSDTLLCEEIVDAFPCAWLSLGWMQRRQILRRVQSRRRRRWWEWGWLIWHGGLTMLDLCNWIMLWLLLFNVVITVMDVKCVMCSVVNSKLTITFVGSCAYLWLTSWIHAYFSILCQFCVSCACIFLFLCQQWRGCLICVCSRACYFWNFLKL